MNSPVSPASVDFGPPWVVDSWPGPAMIVLADGSMGSNNDAMAALLNVDRSWVPDVLHWVGALPRDGGNVLAIIVKTMAGDVIVEWTATFLPEDATLLFGRDVTLERKLRKALTESRQRYKDLVAISSDFAWETGRDGSFVFVSPDVVLGYPSEALVGRRAETILHDAVKGDALPFDTRRPVDGVELWLRRADGTPACVMVSAAPHYGPAGTWEGARGVCRDITEQREHAAKLARVRAREQLLGHIAQSLRDELDPAKALVQAVVSTSRALAADGCSIYRLSPEGALVLATEAGLKPPEDPAVLAAPLTGAGQPTGEAPLTLRRGGTWFAVAGTSFHHAPNGAVVAWRAADRGTWTEDDELLLAGVAGQIGIAHAQADYQARLLHLLEHDELTGLLNRRSFMERLGRAVARSTGTAALLYVDLDNFKAVNDRFGHQQGDQVLRTVADLLRAGIRPGDMAGRLGGDEFVVWLARVDEATAEVTAQRLGAGMVILEALSVPERPLGLSIGIAVHHPGSETVSRLLERADTAMYGAKGSGKGRVTEAAPAEAG